MFEEYSNIEFHKNRSSESRVVPWGRTDMTKPKVALHNFTSAPTSNRQGDPCPHLDSKQPADADQRLKPHGYRYRLYFSLNVPYSEQELLEKTLHSCAIRTHW
jgi:hypothetical protein